MEPEKIIVREITQHGRTNVTYSLSSESPTPNVRGVYTAWSNYRNQENIKGSL